MNNNILYISTFFIALIIIYLLKNDILKIKSILKKNLNSDTLVINNFNIPLNDKIYYKIWIKLYAIITIILIHISWLFLTFVCNYKDNTIFFASPPMNQVGEISLSGQAIIDSVNTNYNPVDAYKINNEILILVSQKYSQGNNSKVYKINIEHKIHIVHILHIVYMRYIVYV